MAETNFECIPTNSLNGLFTTRDLFISVNTGGDGTGVGSIPSVEGYSFLCAYVGGIPSWDVNTVAFNVVNNQIWCRTFIRYGDNRNFVQFVCVYVKSSMLT